MVERLDDSGGRDGNLSVVGQPNRNGMVRKGNGLGWDWMGLSWMRGFVGENGEFSQFDPIQSNLIRRSMDLSSNARPFLGSTRELDQEQQDITV